MTSTSIQMGEVAGYLDSPPRFVCKAGDPSLPTGQEYLADFSVKKELRTVLHYLGNVLQLSFWCPVCSIWTAFCKQLRQWQYICPVTNLDTIKANSIWNSSKPIIIFGSKFVLTVPEVS